MRKTFALLVAALAGCGTARADDPKVELKADGLLREMSKSLASSKSFQFDADHVLEVVTKAGERLQFLAQSRVTVQRPNHARSDRMGAFADGTLYYAMELLEGLNAEHFVYQHGPIEPRRAAYWLQQVCHSLAEAHARDLIHRDIKPSNLFVCHYGRDLDFIKVLDFGLTRPLSRTDPRLTSANAVLGTPGYMAPEQIFGHDTGPRTDLYALGCVAYWLVAGVKPFEGQEVGDMMRSHALEAPPPPSRKSGRAIPERFEALIMSCLSKDAEGRPHDADALGRDLETCFCADPWTVGDAREWWETRDEKGRV